MLLLHILFVILEETIGSQEGHLVHFNVLKLGAYNLCPVRLSHADVELVVVNYSGCTRMLVTKRKTKLTTDFGWSVWFMAAASFES